ncbi:MAG: methyltransferase domain-containing protein [Alphaproteobacteria bacterium]|nr:methyltransferase domain-containing protein [Alphaproteobacteria bacterium]
MSSDVVDLHGFYASGLGQMARQALRRRIRQMWPNLAGETVLGLGYATPFLGQFLGEAQRGIALMPASQGVMHWPGDAPNLVALSDDVDLPLPDQSVDRVLLVHALEHSEQVRPMLREIWRVLSGNGRLMVVAPNRRGIWARFDRTPFGHGHPYSTGQLTRLLKDNMFVPLQTAGALMLPPLRSRMMLSSWQWLEDLGQRWFPSIAGAVLIEANKQIYAASVERPVRRRILVALPEPAARGVGRGTARRLDGPK